MEHGKVEARGGRCEVRAEHRGYRVLVSSCYSEADDDWAVQVSLRKRGRPVASYPPRGSETVRVATLEEAIRRGLDIAEESVDQRLGR